MSDARRARRTFTLVELLMVITILAILAMLLLPVLSNAKRQARRVVCMSNLHQYGTAFIQYAADHNRQLPLIVRDYGGSMVNPLPGCIWLGASHRGTSTPPSGMSGALDVTAYFNFESFAAYTTLPDFATHQVGRPWHPGGIWYCPEFEPARLMQPPPLLPWWNLDKEWEWGRQCNPYAYFGRADEIQTYEGAGLSNWANFYPELVFKDLTADRLLMADMLFRWWGTGGGWMFNHGRNGFVSMTEAVMTPFDSLGQNQLYGDGRVVWAKPSPDELAAIYTMAPTSGRVGGGPTADNTFYLRGR